MVADIVQAFDGLSACIDNAAKVVQAFRNRKKLQSALRKIQEAAGAKPLNLIAYANTRKWSSALRVLSRLCRFRNYMQVLLNEHGDDEGLPSIDWDVAEMARAILWPLYVEQMVLQRDSSTAIHLAQSFEKIRLRLTVMVEHLRSRHYADAADALKAKWERHYGYVTSSGVNALSLSLWPTPSLSQLQTQPSSS